MTSKGLGLTLPDKMQGLEGLTTDKVGAILTEAKIISTNSDIKEIKFQDNAKFATGSGVEVNLKDGQLSILAAADATIAQVNTALKDYGVEITGKE